MLINPIMVIHAKSKAVVLIPTSRYMTTTITNMTAMKFSRALAVILIKLLITLGVLTLPPCPVSDICGE
jgi:hypothetical protein